MAGRGGGGSVLGTAFVEIRPDLTGFGQGLADGIDQSGTDVEGAAREQGDRAGRGWVDTFKGHLAAMGVQFGVQQVTQFFSGAIGGAREAEEAAQGLTQVLGNMGQEGAAPRMMEYATALSQATAVEDETIIAAQTLLGTFSGVAASAGEVGGTMDRATAAAVDLAAAGFGSVESNATMLGKALQDPAGRMSALTRSGVNFTDQQVEMVASLQASGDLLGAQAIVLGEVERQVGGTGAATATETDKMAVAWGEVQEQIGAALLPVLEDLSSFLMANVFPIITDLVGVIRQMDDAWKASVEWIKENKDWLIPLGVVVVALTSNIIANTAATIANTVASKAAALASKAWAIAQGLLNAVLNANPIMLAVAAIAALVAGIIWAYQNVDWFRAAVDATWQAIQVAWDAVLAAFQAVIDWLRNNWANIATIITGPIGIAVRLVVHHWDTITAAFRGAWETIKSVVSGGVNAVVGFVTGIPGRLGALATSVLNAAVGIGRSIVDGIGRGLSGVVGVAGDIGRAVADAVKGAINHVIDLLNNGIPNSLGWGPASIDIPDNPIPRLHSGGIVPGRPGADVWTLLRAGEGVFTEGQMAALGGSGGPAVAIAQVNVMAPLDLDLLVGRLNAAVEAGRL